MSNQQACKRWQVYLDSNQGMTGSKPVALPLGDRPADCSLQRLNQSEQEWCGRRDLNSHTSRRQNLNLVRLPISPLPHSDATDCIFNSDESELKNMVRKERLELSHLAAPEPKSGASTNFATSAQIVFTLTKKERWWLRRDSNL